MATLPGSSDIYLEAGGRKMAVAHSCRAAARKSGRGIEAFGEIGPAAAITGQPGYSIELTRLYATDSAISDGIGFRDMADFSLVIVKPGRRIVYAGCNWSRIDGSGEIGDFMAERAFLIAASRTETGA